MDKRKTETRIEQPPGGTNADLVNILGIHFFPEIIKQFPQHFLRGRRPDLFIRYIKKYRRTHPYFLRFEVKEFYPELAMESLYNLMLSSFRMLRRDHITVSEWSYLYNGLHSFFTCRLRGDTAEDKRLSVHLVPYVLLGVCSILSSFPFLCTRREFLVFLPGKSSAKPLVSRIQKELGSLGLRTGSPGFLTGSFISERVIFAGINLEGGEIGIPGEITNRFLSEIEKLTNPDRRYCSPKSFYKQVNRRIRKFGHYYKYAGVQDLFSGLDKVIRYYIGMYKHETNNGKVTTRMENDGEIYKLCSLAEMYEEARQAKRKGKMYTANEIIRLPFVGAPYLGIEQMFSHHIGFHDGFINRWKSYKVKSDEFILFENN